MSRIRTDYTVFRSVFHHYMCEGGKGDLSLKALARVTGIELRTLQAYRAGECSPNEDKEARIVEALGDDFRVALSAARGMTAVPTDGTATPQELHTAAARLTAELTEAMADGRIDHQERPNIERHVRRVLLAAAGFLVKARAA